MKFCKMGWRKENVYLVDADICDNFPFPFRIKDEATE